jgi:hypothetical protein
VNSTVLFLTANRQTALSLAIHLLVILSVAHLYMINAWENALSTAVFFEGFLGTTMVAVILAISRPRVGEYSSFYARLLWGLAIPTPCYVTTSEKNYCGAQSPAYPTCCLEF